MFTQVFSKKTKKFWPFLRPEFHFEILLEASKYPQLTLCVFSPRHASPNQKQHHFQHQNGAFSHLEAPGLYIFQKLFIFFIAHCNIMPYDAPSTPSQKINRKWAWSAKIASKWRFFVPGLYIFFNFFFFIALCHIMPYDAPSTPSQKPNWKWACSAKIRSKCRFFVPGLYFFFFF